MNESASAKPDASNNQPNEHKAQYKHCRECCAKLPASAYGFYRYTKDRLTQVCKECRSQTQRIKRQAKYQTKGISDDEIVRNIVHHNTNLITYALSQKVCTLIGFQPHTDKVYKVVFGPSAQLGMDAICIFSTDGNMLRELAYSGQTKEIIDELLGFIKQHNLRLELNEVQMMTSKNVIYWV
jgi:hypothetical protein